MFEIGDAVVCIKGDKHFTFTDNVYYVWRLDEKQTEYIEILINNKFCIPYKKRLFIKLIELRKLKILQLKNRIYEKSRM